LWSLFSPIASGCHRRCLLYLLPSLPLPISITIQYLYSSFIYLLYCVYGISSLFLLLERNKGNMERTKEFNNECSSWFN
jgi:hypothetical protein